MPELLCNECGEGLLVEIERGLLQCEACGRMAAFRPLPSSQEIREVYHAVIRETESWVPPKKRGRSSRPKKRNAKRAKVFRRVLDGVV